MSSPTYHEIATSYSLWSEYHDPGNTMTEEEFNAMTYDERIESLTKCHGPEEPTGDIED